MAIDIKAPLADRLFALGSMTGTADNPAFKYEGGNRGSYHGSVNMPAPQENPNEGGQYRGLASLAGAVIGAYSGAGQPSATNAEGQGFGLGGNLVKGDVGQADYAGTRGIFSFGDEPQNAGTSGMFDDFKYGGSQQPKYQSGLYNNFKYGSNP